MLFEDTFENTQWRKVKRMSGEQVYYNHLRQAIYGDIHILGQIILKCFGEVTQNCLENYTIFRGNDENCNNKCWKTVTGLTLEKQIITPPLIIFYDFYLSAIQQFHVVIVWIF